MEKKQYSEERKFLNDVSMMLLRSKSWMLLFYGSSLWIVMRNDHKIIITKDQFNRAKTKCNIVSEKWKIILCVRKINQTKSCCFCTSLLCFVTIKFKLLYTIAVFFLIGSLWKTWRPWWPPGIQQPGTHIYSLNKSNHSRWRVYPQGNRCGYEVHAGTRVQPVEQEEIQLFYFWNLSEFPISLEQNQTFGM